MIFDTHHLWCMGLENDLGPSPNLFRPAQFLAHPTFSRLKFRSIVLRCGRIAG